MRDGARTFDIRRPLDFRDPVPVFQSTGAMRRHKTQVSRRRTRSDDLESGVGRHTHGGDEICLCARVPEKLQDVIFERVASTFIFLSCIV